jgi:hypothetical protein
MSCRLCGHMSENDKDYGSPTFKRIYGLLAAMAILQEPDNFICDWLNQNGFANLTCCPECHFDDFTHVVGCSIGEAVDKVVRQNRPKI